MIGNDIVDFSLLKPLSGQRKKRYYKKTFTEHEIRLIDTLNMDFVEGFLWSIKESSYKAYFRTNPVRINNPKKMEVHQVSLFKNSATAKCSTPSGSFVVKVDIHPSHFHAVASPLKSNIIHGIILNSETYKNRVLEELFKARVVDKKACIIKDANNIPTIIAGANKLPLSLSHDGRWAGFACLVD